MFELKLSGRKTLRRSSFHGTEVTAFASVLRRGEKDGTLIGECAPTGSKILGKELFVVGCLVASLRFLHANAGSTQAVCNQDEIPGFELKGCFQLVRLRTGRLCFLLADVLTNTFNQNASAKRT